MPLAPKSMTTSRRRFCLVLVKPTHYCDEGYTIQWLRSAIPSNSLACLAGIAQDFIDHKVLGENVDIENRQTPTR